jgi:hypothetical protein
MRYLLTLLLILVPCAAAAQDPYGQRPAALTSVRQDPAAHPGLLRMIRVAFADVTIADALHGIADSAGIGISYSRDALPDVRVRLAPARLSAGAAFNAVLAGTGLDAFVSASGNVAIAPAVDEAATASPAQPPVLQGRVLDEESGRPLPGVFVVLVDGQGAVRAGVLSRADGRFIMRAPAAGRYALRYELIGYATRQTDELPVRASVTVPDATLAPAAISLASIHVAASEGGCRLSRDSGVETYRVWHEARKALSVTAWAEHAAGVAYQAVLYDFSRDVVSGEVLPEQPVQRRVASGIGRAPFVSAAAAELAADGFVRSLASGGYMYYGLDAATLLTPAFLENYCFRARLPQRDSDVVGLAFEPARARPVADIAGVLWLDRRSLEIRWLEYHYTSHPGGDLPLELFGGRFDFRRLPSGAWIISDWWIRMPETGPAQPLPAALRGAPPGGLQALRAAGLTIREAGGTLRFVDAAQHVAGVTGTISGAVYDSTRMRPLRGAVVFVAGAGSVARTDADGHFELRGLEPGEHRVGFFHPYTDSLALPIATTAVTAAADTTGFVALSVPASALCPWDGADEVPAVGFVVDRSGTPAPGVVVVATWRRSGQADAQRGVQRAVQRGAGATGESRATTDGFGRFTLCGLPPSTDVQIQAARSRAVSLRTPGHGLSRQDLVIR